MVRVEDETQAGKCNGGCKPGTVKLRDEFRLEHLALGHHEAECFVKAQFFRPPAVYLGWTLFWVLYYTANLCLEVYYHNGSGAHHFVFLTNWSYLLQATLVYSDLGVTAYVFWKRIDILRGESKEVTWYIKVHRVVYNISNVASVVVTVFYYALLPSVRTFNHTSVNTHFMNTVYTILLVLFSAKPTRILHVYQPLVYVIVYFIFSVIYHASGGAPIYEVLHWDDVNNSLLVSFMTTFVGVPVAHVFIFGLYALRVFIASRYLNADSPNLQREVTFRDVELHLQASEKTRNSDVTAPSCEKASC